LFLLDERRHRGANGPNRQRERGPDADFMGPRQVGWLKAALASSRATWKFVCSDMPLSLVVSDANGSEAFANADDGPPLGRELEIADLLAHLQREKVRNVVWLTADVHYCASHHYHPSRAKFVEFDPFWEFVSGPLHAGTFGPTPLDHTFGPEVRFSSRRAGDPAAGPWTRHQFFGTVRIDPATKAATVTHFDRDGTKLWDIALEAVV
jgi:alkaline phosphatase D